MKWAITRGNSTKANNAPGGLGFSIILDFLQKNQGEFILISGNEYFCKNLKGTEETDFSYILVDEDIESIKF